MIQISLHQVQISVNNVWGAGHTNWSNILKILFFQSPQRLKFYIHAMGCLGTGLRMFFKDLCVTYEFFEKIEKTAQKLLFSSSYSVRGPPQDKYTIFELFFRFSWRVREWRPNLYRGETILSKSRNTQYHVLKVWELFKEFIFFDDFLTISHGLSSHELITVIKVVKQFFSILIFIDVEDEFY